jgi:hypothetical protein
LHVGEQSLDDLEDKCKVQVWSKPSSAKAGAAQQPPAAAAAEPAEPPAAASAAVVPEGVPKRELTVLVQKTELVPSNRKMAAASYSSVEELLQHLVATLELPMAAGGGGGGVVGQYMLSLPAASRAEAVALSSLQALGAKCKLQVWSAQAPPSTPSAEAAQQATAQAAKAAAAAEVMMAYDREAAEAAQSSADDMAVSVVAASSDSDTGMKRRISPRPLDPSAEWWVAVAVARRQSGRCT